MVHAMPERQSASAEEELKSANRLFAWFQRTDDELPPSVNERAYEVLAGLQSSREDLPQVRMAINELDEALKIPLRVYVSGFDEAIVRQLDNEGVFDTARSLLHLELVTTQLESVSSVQPSVETLVSVEPSKVATGGIARRPGRPRKVREAVVEVNNLDEPTESDLAELNSTALDDVTEREVEQLAGTRLDADLVKQYLKEIGKYPLLNAVQEVELAKSIEVGILAKERLNLRGDALSHEERQELEFLVKQGVMDKELFTQSNLRLVVSITKRYTGRGMLFLDLIQEGNTGLIRAVEKFDYAKGYKFSTYATWWIKQATTRAMADQARTIRVPVHMVETINKLGRVQRQMVQDLGREPTPEELARELDMSAEKVIEVQGYGRNPVSLHTPISDEGRGELGDLIEDTSDEADTANRAMSYEIPEALFAVLNTLNEREAGVVSMRFGLTDGEPKTLDEIGKVYGVTRERIRQIEAKTMSKLRHPSRSHLLRGFAFPKGS